MVGEETFAKMASRLEIDQEQVEIYRARLPGFKSEKLSFTPLAADHFQSIADWHHYAILEAVTLHDFDPSPEWVSEKLNISQSKAKEAIERLVRLGCLEMKAGRLATSVKNHTTVDLPTPTGACREHERQILGLAIRALDDIPIESRDQSSLTLAIPSSRFKEAREKIDQFRGEMASLLQRRGKRDTIYHLSVSFYPVTNPKPSIKNQEKKP